MLHRSATEIYPVNKLVALVAALAEEGRRALLLNAYPTVTQGILYSGVSGPTSLGSGNAFVSATTGSGDAFGLPGGSLLLPIRTFLVRSFKSVTHGATPLWRRSGFPRGFTSTPGVQALTRTP